MKQTGSHSNSALPQCPMMQLLSHSKPVLVRQVVKKSQGLLILVKGSHYITLLEQVVD